MAEQRITIYTDGSIYPNPGGIGGWAAILIHPHKTIEISGSQEGTTNNQMELTAAIEALKALKRPCAIDLYTDSQYVQRGITEWIDRWIVRRWHKVKNVELWQELYILNCRHNVAWYWVKGHADNEFNNRVDELAAQARLNHGKRLDG